jgi:hypothetical protein
MLGNSSVGERLAASQKGLRSMELVTNDRKKSFMATLKIFFSFISRQK